MKVLCPIDFSEVSVNACKWITQLLHEIDNVELHLCHFIYFNRRANMFLSIDNIFFERAETDLAELIKWLRSSYPSIKVTHSIYKAHPKEGIIAVVKKDNYDLVVTGTSGLNAIKDMTVGSVTQYIFDHCTVPVLAVPANFSEAKVSKVALAVDDELLKKLGTITFLRDLSVQLKASVHVVHITEEGESPFEYDPAIDMIFKKVDFAYDRIPLDKSLAHTLKKYANSENVDMLCMVHHKRNWLRKLIGKSVTKSELFNLEVPLLVLNDS